MARANKATPAYITKVRQFMAHPLPEEKIAQLRHHFHHSNLPKEGEPITYGHVIGLLDILLASSERDMKHKFDSATGAQCDSLGDKLRVIRNFRILAHSLETLAKEPIPEGGQPSQARLNIERSGNSRETILMHTAAMVFEDHPLLAAALGSMDHDFRQLLPSRSREKK